MALFKKDGGEEVKHNVPLFNSHKKEVLSDIKDMNSTRGVENMLIGVNRYMERTPWEGRGDRPAKKVADEMKKKLDKDILTREKREYLNIEDIPF